MSASVYISKNENESRAFTNHCDNHINFDTIAKICVGGQYNLKFPVAAKQNKINIKNKLDIKIPLNNKNSLKELLILRIRPYIEG